LQIRVCFRHFRIDIRSTEQATKFPTSHEEHLKVILISIYFLVHHIMSIVYLLYHKTISSHQLDRFHRDFEFITIIQWIKSLMTGDTFDETACKFHRKIECALCVVSQQLQFNFFRAKKGYSLADNKLLWHRICFKLILFLVIY
jgi:hypothetical protein